MLFFVQRATTFAANLAKEGWYCWQRFGGRRRVEGWVGGRERGEGKGAMRDIIQLEWRLMHTDSRPALSPAGVVVGSSGDLDAFSIQPASTQCTRYIGGSGSLPPSLVLFLWGNMSEKWRCGSTIPQGLTAIPAADPARLRISEIAIGCNAVVLQPMPFNGLEARAVSG